MKRTIKRVLCGLVVTCVCLPSVRGDDGPIVRSIPHDEAAEEIHSVMDSDGVVESDGVVYGDSHHAGVTGNYHHMHPHPWYAYHSWGTYAANLHAWNMQQAMQQPWHGGYRHTEWGRPLALIVPPTADNKTVWSWGVGQTRVVPIYHQFRRGVPPMSIQGEYQFRATPQWPSNTEQFGVYPIRGPW